MDEYVKEQELDRTGRNNMLLNYWEKMVERRILHKIEKIKENAERPLF